MVQFRVGPSITVEEIERMAHDLWEIPGSESDNGIWK